MKTNVLRFLRSVEGLGFCLLLMAVILIFARTLSWGPLAWDDDANIFSNPFFLNREWGAIWLESYMGLYVPVASMVWAALAQLDSVWPYRLLNLLLHLANVTLFFNLLRHLALRWQMGAGAVLAGTLVFALHPLQMEAVAWITGGRDLLATFFALAAVTVLYARSSKASFALASAFFIAALLSKPVVVILPLGILVFECIQSTRPERRRMIQMAIWTVFAMAIVALTRMAQAPAIEFEYGFGQRFLVMFDSLGFYIQKFVYPFPLSGNYARTPGLVLEQRLWVTSLVVLLTVLGGFSFLSWRTDRRYALIWLWIVLLTPMSGLIIFANQSVSTVADHYQYFAMTGMATFVAFVVSRIVWQRVHSWASFAVWFICLLIFAGVSWHRTTAWANDEAFFTDMAVTAPDAFETAIGMSVVMCGQKKNYEEGVLWTERALRARPLDVLALANQALCFLHARKYFRVIELEFQLGQLNLEEAEIEDPEALASLLASIGTAYIEQQQFADGHEYLCEAYRVMPSNPERKQALEAAAALLQSKGQKAECRFVDEEEQSEPIEDIWPEEPQEEEP